MKNPKNAEECAKMLGEARSSILELRHALKRCANDRKELIEGIVTANNEIGEFIDKYFDEDPPEGSMGSPQRSKLRNLQAHLDGTCINGKTGEFMERNEFDAFISP